MDIKDKVVVVTGGASGIGEALCRRFAQAGAKGVVVADVNEAGATRIAKGIKGSLPFRCDVRREADIGGPGPPLPKKNSVPSICSVPMRVFSRSVDTKSPMRNGSASGKSTF